VRTEAAFGAERGTYAVREIGNQVADFDIAGFEFAVQPTECVVSSVAQRKIAATSGGADAHHLVNVFCWTLTHCCSSGAIFSGFVHQCSQEARVHVGRNRRADVERLVVSVFGAQTMRGCW
jgi:hypothetical protein